MSIKQLRNAKIITAMVTPFKADGSINYDALPKLIEHLLEHHTDGLLLAGTTAESPTLTHEEELELFSAVQKIVNGRVPLIAGIGTNDTRDSVEFAKEVAEFGGFAAGLAIVPYYNKPTQEGLYQHFAAIYEMLEALEQGDIKKAAQIQRHFIPKVNALFSVSSPAPVKAVLNHQGFKVGPLRLPLVSCTNEQANEIIKVVLSQEPSQPIKGVLRPTEY